ncbi:molybdenum cofactor synthesis domain-containing protein [Polychytrium aggregatum]|uniref:molybdenum cofactor synthesis domain-containing protein n=1 Tax=Polychytrium aggregatum TaxID=110093 RepID=UPI0022FEEF27|nr:molybdenum cofactor synthesis domain-containing protein [Polychytrium aggregatum]KAI9206197.1 molybdenum cofactor synthesis domain-containing protein [Polychytrium aggregatum]
MSFVLASRFLKPGTPALVRYTGLVLTDSIKRYSSTRAPGSVGCLIIGDEILNGKTLDTNSNYLAKACFQHGLELKRIAVVPDAQEEIADSVLEMSSKYQYVFTSGGIGPTHDDITYESIAKAFDLPLVLHEPTIRRMENIKSAQTGKRWIFTDDPADVVKARERMALLPTGPNARVEYPCPHLWVPISIVDNVHILPGIPKLFRDLVDDYFRDFLASSQRFHRLLIGTAQLESTIAKALTDIQADASRQDVKIGSYPLWAAEGQAGRNVRVVVSVVGRDQASVEQWAQRITAAVDGHPYTPSV